MTSKLYRSISFVVFGAALATGCGKSAPAPAAPAPVQGTEPAATAVVAQVEAGSWEAFYPRFQEAVASGDVEQLRALCHFGEGLDAADFDEYYEPFFSAEMKEVIATSNAATWSEMEEEPGVWQVVWSASSEEDGEIYESALFLYFKQVNGEFRMFRWMAAG